MPQYILVSGFAPNRVHVLPLLHTGKLGALVNWKFEAPNPTYLASFCDNKGVSNIYTASRALEGGASSAVALNVRPEDPFTDPPNAVPFVASEAGVAQDGHGTNSCYVKASPSGKWVVLCNWASGSVAVFPRSPHDGSLGPAACVLRPGKNTHQCVFDGAGRALIPCMGNDQILVCSLDESSGELAVVHTTDTLAGSGPRHLVFNAARTFVYW